jgi:hypothetical protein
MEPVAPLRQDKSRSGRIQRLAAVRREVMSKNRRVGEAHLRSPPPWERGRRAEKRKTYGGPPLLLGEAAGAFRRASTRIFECVTRALRRLALSRTRKRMLISRRSHYGTGPRFRLCVVPLPEPVTPTSCVEGWKATAHVQSRQPAPGRTSYWVRGELRCRPGASLRRSPQAPHPVPPIMTPHERAPQRTRWRESNRGFGAGDKCEW